MPIIFSIAFSWLIIFVAFYTQHFYFKCLLTGYVSISSITFIIYAYDKWQAIRQQRRIPEKTLHFLSLCGGWIGASFAQLFFRHKTLKQPFLSIFYCTILANLVCFLGISYFIVKSNTF